MIIFFQTCQVPGAKDKGAFQCAGCGSAITWSDRLLSLGGTNRHFFINPAGIECDFHTFLTCPGATAFGEARSEHTWFEGYTWRMACCSNCGLHLGWNYEGVSNSGGPYEFWGILVSRLLPDPA